MVYRLFSYSLWFELYRQQHKSRNQGVYNNLHPTVPTPPLGLEAKSLKNGMTHYWGLLHLLVTSGAPLNKQTNK